MRCLRNLLITAFAIVSATAWGQSLFANDDAPKLSSIVQLLENEKPNLAVIAKLELEASVEPPYNLSLAALIDFYFNRAQVKYSLARNTEGFEDNLRAANLAVRGSIEDNKRFPIFLELATQSRYLRNYDEALKIADLMEREFKFGISTLQIFKIRIISFIDLQMTSEARHVFNDLFSLTEDLRRAKDPAIRDLRWQSIYHELHGRVLRAEGNFAGAADEFKEATAQYKSLLKLANLKIAEGSMLGRLPSDRILRSMDATIILEGLSKLAQGKLIEAEANIRRGVYNQLNRTGKYDPNSALYLHQFVNVLTQEGKFYEAEKVVDYIIEILDDLHQPHSSFIYAAAFLDRARILEMEGRSKEALRVWDECEKQKSEESWIRMCEDPLRVKAFFDISDLSKGTEVAEAIASRRKTGERGISQSGGQELQLAIAKGLFAVGLFKSGDPGYREAFGSNIPQLAKFLDSRSSGLDQDSGSTKLLSAFIIENFLESLNQSNTADM